MRNTKIVCLIIIALGNFYPCRTVFAQNSQDQLSAAYELGKEGKVDQAVEMYLDFYRKNPQRHEVLQNIAELYEKDKRYDEAVDYMEKLLVKDADFLFQGAHFKDECDRLLGVWDKAGAVKANSMELASEHYTAKLSDKNASLRMKAVSQIMLGDITDKAKNIDKAREHYYRAFELVEPATDDWEKCVNQVILRKFKDKRLYDDAVTVYKNYPDYSNLIFLGQWLKQQGRGYEMVDLYKDYLLHSRQEKNDASLWYENADYSEEVIDELLRLKIGESLIGQFETRITDEPKNSELHKKFGYMLMKMQRNEEGLREIEKFLSTREKTSASDYEWAGDICEKSGLIDSTIAYYEAARNTEITDAEVRRASMMSQMAASPDFWKQRYKAQILEKLGNIYVRQTQWSKAESCFKEIVEMEGNRKKENAQKKLAQIWEQMGKENTFIENTEKKLTQEPQNIEVRVDYARTLLNSNKSAEAVKQYEKAVELSPEDISLRLRLADALAEDKQNDSAIDEYKTAMFMAAKKNENEFIHTKGGDETEPRFILNRLSVLCEKAGQKDKLLDIDAEVLVMLDSPDTKWKPDEYVLKNILRDMTEIYEAKGQYSPIIELWLGYHKEMTYYSRSVIDDQLQYVETLKPFIERLQKETSEAKADYWGEFVLADMLYAQNDKDKAMEVYMELLKNASADSRLQEELIRVFQRMNKYDLMLEASIKALANYQQGSEDYGRAMGRIGDLYVKLNDRERAAESYRKAITCDISRDEQEQFRKVLFNMTDGREGREQTGSVTIKSLVDLDALRLQAEKMLGTEKNYSGAEKIYKEILEKAPIDLQSMVHLGEVYERTNRINEAVSMFEKVTFDDEMRRWAPSPDAYYGATGDLERIYRQKNDIKNQIKLFTLTGSGNFEDINNRCRNNEERQQFNEYLMEQSKQTPDNLKLNFYLVRYFLEREEKAKAEEIAEKLYKELSDEQGVVNDKNNAIELAKSFESLGNFEKALKVLSSFDYESDTDVSFDRFGEILVRLYSKANQFDKALETCGLRLKKDPRGNRTVQIAEQIAECSLSSDDGPRLLPEFLEKLKEEIPESNYRRFRGAVQSYIEAHPELSKNTLSPSSEKNLLTLLKQGRIVQTPQDCRSFAEFLEKLASEADTLATQSFMSGKGRQMQAPRINIKQGFAFEILAQALDGTAIPLEITQDGFWALFEAGDTSRKISYAASGGLICTFEGFNSKNDNPNLWALGRVFFEPAVRNNIASIQSNVTVLEAKDQSNRDISIPKAGEGRWNDSGQIEITLGKDSSITSIKKLRVKTAVAFGKRWINMTIDSLSFSEKTVHEEDGIKIEVEKPTESRSSSSSVLQIPVTIQNNNSLDPEGQMRLKKDIYLITKDGNKQNVGYSGGFDNGKQSRLNLQIDISRFNPETTNLVIRMPAAVEIVPFELTFNDVPVIKRQ